MTGLDELRGYKEHFVWFAHWYRDALSISENSEAGSPERRFRLLERDSLSVVVSPQKLEPTCPLPLQSAPHAALCSGV